MLHLNDLIYGAPTEHHLETCQEPTPLLLGSWEDAALPPPPSNDSPQTALEIKAMYMARTKKVLSEDFVRRADEVLLELFETRLRALGIEKPWWVDSLMNQAGAWVMNWKVHSQRPRPYQLAPYLNFELVPGQTLTGHSPAYPSGHSAQAWLLAYMLTKAYGEKGFLHLAKHIAYSRIQLGVHYPSDAKAGEMLAKHLYKSCRIKP